MKENVHKKTNTISHNENNKKISLKFSINRQK
jgi:hypothetical protein